MWSVTKRHAPRSSGLGMPHLCIGLREIKLPTNSAFIVRCIVFFQTMAALDLYELGLDIWGGGKTSQCCWPRSDLGFGLGNSGLGLDGLRSCCWAWDHVLNQLFIRPIFHVLVCLTLLKACIKIADNQLIETMDLLTLICSHFGLAFRWQNTGRSEFSTGLAVGVGT